MKGSSHITELIFIMDGSGSISGREGDMVDGFNAMIEKQRQQNGKVYVSTVLFDNESRILHDRLPLSKIPKMTLRDYSVRGCTALVDAIGGAIYHIENIHKYARPEDVPEHTMFIIITDGQENASYRYSSSAVKRMIEDQKAKCGWEFLFVGANIDAVQIAAMFGIARNRAVNYHADSEGKRVFFDVISDIIIAMRKGQQISDVWGAPIEEDFPKRR